MNPKPLKYFAAMLAQTYADQKIDGWLMSEKLDGVRAIWTGSELVSRNGNKFHAPAWFTSQLPAGVVLDGELFIGRGRFQETAGVVKNKTPVDLEWQTIRYCVFDAPTACGGFAQRIGIAGQALLGNKIARVVEQTLCRNKAHLERFYSEMCSAGAEGIILRDPKSVYEPKRSRAMLKYKPFESAEAVVIGHEAGDGRCLGMVGALVVRWKDIVFRVGSGMADAIRSAPPKVGSTITFGFCGVTDAGLPRFPTFQAVRDYE